MDICDLIHLFYKTVGKTKGRLLAFGSHYIKVGLNNKFYEIDINLRVYLLDNFSKYQNDEEIEISNKLIEEQDAWLLPSEQYYG
jgi:hypothetical protein